MLNKSSLASAIQFKEVYKKFGEAQEEVLKGVSLDFPMGQLTYILGSSGAGKSVLLKHILGLLRPTRGEVWVGSECIHQLSRRKLAQARMQFGMLFQDAALFDDWNVFENVAFPLREHTRLNEKEIFKKVEKALAILGMETGLDKYPNELSGGMRKRVGLARAIIREPSILLYDEPTTGLDPITRTKVDELIAKLKRELKLTSIVISHDIPSALMLADCIAFLHKGKIVFFGTPSEFKKSQVGVIQEFIAAEERMIRTFDLK